MPLNLQKHLRISSYDSHLFAYLYVPLCCPVSYPSLILGSCLWVYTHFLQFFRKDHQNKMIHSLFQATTCDTLCQPFIYFTGSYSIIRIKMVTDDVMTNYFIDILSQQPINCNLSCRTPSVFGHRRSNVNSISSL